MKFTASKTDLQAAMTTAIRAVPSHTTMPILNCVLITAFGMNNIIITSNDMDMGIETRIRGTVDREGFVAIDAKMFSDIIRKMPNEIVTFESDEQNNIKIRSGRAKFDIGGKNGEEFPSLPSIERDEGIMISQFTLKSVINQTIFSLAANDNNKIMTGELFEIKGNILRLVALDGHRIAIRKVALKEECRDRKVIIPGKTLSDISKILPGEMNENVIIYFSKNHIIFEIPGTRVISRLIDGEYFNVDSMISRDYETKITLNRNEYISCVDRALLFVKEGDKKPLINEIEDQTIRISIESPLGSMNDELEAEKEGKDIYIGFNPKFLMDVLRVIEDDSVSLYLISPKAPCFIRDEDETYIYIVLPVNFVR